MIDRQDISYLSRKCRILSFLAAVGVVAIHSDCTIVMEDPASWNVFVEKFYCQRLMKWAVPFFFTLSGIWFARGSFAKGETGYFHFLGKKIRSLAVPWILFAIAGVIFLTPLVVLNNHITHRELLSRTVFESGSVWQAINDTFAITIPQPKMAGFLWYVRTLFVLFLLAPVWRFLLRISPWLFLAGFIALEIFPVDIYCVYFGACYCFFLGVFLGAYRNSALLFKTVRTYAASLFLCVGIAMAVVWAGVDAGWWRFPVSAYWWKQATPLSLGAGVWMAYDIVAHRLPRELPRFVNWSMWVYLFHSMVASYFLSASRFLLGKSDAVMVWLPAANIVFTTLVCIGLGYFMSRRCPRLFDIICGGRK